MFKKSELGIKTCSVNVASLNSIESTMNCQLTVKLLWNNIYCI